MEGLSLNIPEKVLRYEQFINDCLKEDLKKTHRQLDGVISELAEFLQLKNTINGFQQAELIDGGIIKAQMDIGCNVYMQANITDTSVICINVGCGHFVEFTMDEALVFIDKRIGLLTRTSDILKKRSATIKAHIKLVLHGIQEIQNIK